MSRGKKHAGREATAKPGADGDAAERETRPWDAEKVRKRLLQLASAKSVRAFAKKLGKDESLVRAWFRPHAETEKPTLPASETLYLIGQKTGVSIDWLLGFDDVPMMRKDRALVGQLGRALVVYVAHKCPSAAVLGGYVRDLDGAVSRAELPAGSVQHRFAVRSGIPNEELVIEPDAQQRFLDDVVRWAVGRRRVMDAAASLDAASEWPHEDAGPDWVHDNKDRARAYAVRAGNVATNTVDGAVVRLVDMETGAHVDWPGHPSRLRAPAEG